MVKPETEFSLLDRKQSLKGYKQKKRKVGGPKQNAKRTRIVCVLWSLYHIICVYSNQVVGLAGGHWTRTQLRMWTTPRDNKWVVVCSSGSGSVCLCTMVSNRLWTGYVGGSGVTSSVCLAWLCKHNKLSSWTWVSQQQHGTGGRDRNSQLAASIAVTPLHRKFLHSYTCIQIYMYVYTSTNLCAS